MQAMQQVCQRVQRGQSATLIRRDPAADGWLQELYRPHVSFRTPAMLPLLSRCATAMLRCSKIRRGRKGRLRDRTGAANNRSAPPPLSRRPRHGKNYKTRRVAARIETPPEGRAPDPPSGRISLPLVLSLLLLVRPDRHRHRPADRRSGRPSDVEALGKVDAQAPE